jgi:hypothetical protein
MFSLGHLNFIPPITIRRCLGSSAQNKSRCYGYGLHIDLPRFSEFTNAQESLYSNQTRQYEWVQQTFMQRAQSYNRGKRPLKIPASSAIYLRIGP